MPCNDQRWLIGMERLKNLHEKDDEALPLSGGKYVVNFSHRGHSSVLAAPSPRSSAERMDRSASRAALSAADCSSGLRPPAWRAWRAALFASAESTSMKRSRARQSP